MDNVTDDLVNEALADEETIEGNETPAVDGDAPASDYQPSYSYKVLDEERTFDPRLHGVIKSKEDEEYLRDLYTKADGLEQYKNKYGTISNEYNSFKTQIMPVVDSFKKLKSYKDEGKFGDLFSDLGVDEDAVLNYALQVAQERALPEEQRRIIQQNREQERTLRETQAQLNYYEQSQHEQVLATQVDELKSYVHDESVSDIREALAKSGQDLSTLVYNWGVGTYQTTGKEPTVKEAFDAVINQYRAFVPRVQAPPAPKQPIERQPVLPKVKGDGGMNQAVKSFSLADLRKMADAIPT